MLLLTYIREHNEIPICDDVFKHVLLPFFTIYDLLKIVTTNKQFKKLIQNIIPDHPYNLHNAIWEGPRLPNTVWEGSRLANSASPFILPENPQNYIFVSANLKYANLSGANLKNANLRGANLEGANLTYSNLRNANLRYVCLTGANLSYVYFRNTNLRYAILRYVKLKGTNLKGANLKGAKTNYILLHKKYRKTILVE
jgi:uncharacterized protein YjbI with pentapeptide repeats